MADSAERPGPPTYFANIATVHVTSDEVSIECRRILVPHAKLARLAKVSPPVPALTEEELYTEQPVAKIVLTFTAAKSLRDNLNNLVGQFEKQRKEGN